LGEYEGRNHPQKPGLGHERAPKGIAKNVGGPSPKEKKNLPWVLQSATSKKPWRYDVGVTAGK